LANRGAFLEEVNMKYIFCLMIVLVLTACGGGGASSTTQPNVSPTTLFGSGGDMSKYLGTWQGDCGTNILAHTSARNTFSFTAVSGAAAAGTLTSTPYSSIDCSGTSSAVAVIVIPTPVTLTYQSSVVAGSAGSGSAGFVGNADKLILAGATTGTNLYIGFKTNYSVFVLDTSNRFSIYDITYKKL
jgi:hypothetical protein